MQEGEGMEERLESAEGEADGLPDPEESTEGGLGVSDLTRGDSEDEADEG